MSKLFSMTSQQSLQLFDIVKRNFKTESDSRLFVTEIDALIASSFKEESTELTTKKDLDVVKTELLKEIALINKETVQLRADLTKEIVLVKADLTKQIDSNKYDLIKWMFSFWITIILLFVGTYLLKK